MESTQQGGSFMEKYGTALAVLLGAVIIGGAFVYGRGTEPAPSGGGAPSALDIKDVKTETSPSIGEKNAPVVMALWYDYQCPFCKKFELETMAQIYENYVTTGKVRIILKDFQFLGPDSDTAGLFARALWEAYPERFYEWYVAMAEHQDEEHGGFGDLATIQAMTKELGGIDVDRVTKLMTTKNAEYKKAIDADREEGAALGISGTPSMIIGTTALSGAQPYDRVAAIIDAELAK